MNWEKIIQQVKAIKAPNLLKNKFFLTGMIFLLWLTFFDKNNLIDLFGEMAKIHSHKNEKEYYEKKIASDREKIKELRTNSKNLEKFAREQYLMKKPNEDIFIVE
jgi:Septum formation initiator.